MSLPLRPGRVSRPGRPPGPKSPAADKGVLVGERVGRGLLRKGPAAMSGSWGLGPRERGRGHRKVQLGQEMLSPLLGS